VQSAPKPGVIVRVANPIFAKRAASRSCGAQCPTAKRIPFFELRARQAETLENELVEIRARNFVFLIREVVIAAAGVHHVVDLD